LRSKLLAHLRHRFVRDAATLQVAALINQTSQLLSTVVIAFLLGSHGQGLFVSALALQALFFFLINLGVTQAVVSQIAAAAARGNDFKLAGWIAFLAKTILVFGATILVIGYFALPAIGELFFKDHQIGVWAWWLCFVPLLELPKLVAIVAFQGTRRMLLLGQVENGHEMVRFFLVVLGALIYQSAEGAVLGTIASSAVGSILAVALYHQARRDGGQHLPGPREIMARTRDVKIRQGIRQGLRIALLKNGQVLFGTVFPRLIIGGVVGMSWVAYFHIAQRFMMVPMMMAQGVSRTLLPALGELAGLRDLDRLRRLFFRASLATGGLISLALLGVLAAIPLLVQRLFPEDYAAPVFHYAWILTLGYVPFAFAVGIESFFIVANQVRVWLLLTVLGALITIPTNVWLIFNIPYTGTAWGLSLYQSWVLVHLGYITWFLSSSRRSDQVWAAADPRAAETPAAGS
jgi:O-antigen/teichoic acid export membrane protein